MQHKSPNQETSSELNCNNDQNLDNYTSRCCAQSTHCKERFQIPCLSMVRLALVHCVVTARTVYVLVMAGHPIIAAQAIGKAENVQVWGIIMIIIVIIHVVVNNGSHYDVVKMYTQRTRYFRNPDTLVFKKNLFIFKNLLPWTYYCK